MNNNTIIGVIIGIALGGIGGYFTAKQTYDVGMSKTEMNDMMKMMTDDGARMEKMGTLMMDGGMMMQERGAKYQDEEMVSKGKDMEVNGKKHKEDGMSMMDGKSMMGMMEGGMMKM
jgi:hypothetical protein